VKSRLQRARAVFTAEAQQRLSRSSWVGGDDDPSR
jgi:hypothetical protein